MNAREHQSLVPTVNMSSNLLTTEENASIFRLLGSKCHTLSTAVMQIYKTEAPAHTQWQKKHTGILCFVKDCSERSYFLRAYCMLKNELIWQYEIYDDMKLEKSRPFLLTFEGEHGHVGLNFVSEEECDAFHRAVTNTIETRNRKRMEKHHPKRKNSTPPPCEHSKDQPKISEASSNNTDNSAVQMHEDEVLNHFFFKAGVFENELKDRDTRAFIYDFIRSNNVQASVKKEAVKGPTTELKVSAPHELPTAGAQPIPAPRTCISRMPAPRITTNNAAPIYDSSYADAASVLPKNLRDALVDALAEALQRVLSERSCTLQSSDDKSESSHTDEECKNCKAIKMCNEKKQ